VNSNYRYRFLDNQTTRRCRGSRRPDELSDRPRLKRRVCLYGRQHSKETFPSGTMNDIATDVAAAIQ
jgi:hypothetical protein